MSRIPSTCLCIAVSLCGCAAPIDVRSVGTGTAAQAFELRGAGLAALDAQAKALCPAGHTVLRQWQRMHRQSLAPERVANWVASHQTANGVVSGVLDDGEAQLTVQCTVAASP